MSIINVLIHSHKEGLGIYPFRVGFLSNITDDDLPQIAFRLGLNYEPEREENLELTTIDTDEIQNILFDSKWVGRSEAEIEAAATIIVEDRE